MRNARANPKASAAFMHGQTLWTDLAYYEEFTLELLFATMRRRRWRDSCQSRDARYELVIVC